MKLAHGLLALAAAGILWAGCGEGGGAGTAESPSQDQQKPHPVYITLDGLPGPEIAGILMARERGYFADLGLEVAMTPPITPRNVLGYVMNEDVDLGISHEPQVVMAEEKGVPIATVASLVREPTMAMIWLAKSKIRDIADLRGKTIAIVDLPFEEGFLRSILARAGMTLDDVRVKRAGYQLVPDLISGRVDAAFGGSWNVEGVELEERGLDPTVMRVQKLGIPPYDELVVIARRDRASRDRRLIRAFVAALARGTAAASEDPEAAAEVVARAAEELEPPRREEVESDGG